MVELGGMEWQYADPFETQYPYFAEVIDGPGLYLWLRRAKPGPYPEATDDVLYVGQSTNVQNRLLRYSSVSYTREDPVIHAVFDHQIAPRLSPERVKELVICRRSTGIATMWIRDHVVFAWAPWPGPGRIAQENFLRGVLLPWFNSKGNNWTGYASTEHSDHDFTLPLTPVPLHQTAKRRRSPSGEKRADEQRLVDVAHPHPLGQEVG